jgi:CIC family chloride channel protein
MHAATEILPAQMTVREAVGHARTSQLRAWPVAEDGSIVGVLSQARLESAASDVDRDKMLRDLLDPLDFPHVHSDHALHLALERMSMARLELLPVVSRADVHKLEGIVTVRDVLDSYGVDSSGSA